MTVVVYGKYYIEFNFILFLFIFLKFVVGTLEHTTLSHRRANLNFIKHYNKVLTPG